MTHFYSAFSSGSKVLYNSLKIAKITLTKLSKIVYHDKSYSFETVFG